MAIIVTAVFNFPHQLAAITFPCSAAISLKLSPVYLSAVFLHEEGPVQNLPQMYLLSPEMGCKVNYKK